MAKRKKKNRARRRNNSRRPLAVATVTHNKPRLRCWRPPPHRECFATLVSDGSGEQRISYSINPSLDMVFPWLCAMAQNFESYKFHSLSFHYMTSTNATESGTIVLAPDYDADDDNATLTRRQLMSFDDTMRCSVWQNGVLRCSKKNLQKRNEYFVRKQHEAHFDKKLFDTCKLEVLFDSTSSITLGDLWVHYDVEFFTPQTSSGPVGVYRIYSENLSSNGEWLSDTTQTDGKAVMLASGDPLPSVSIESTDTLKFIKAGARYVANQYATQGIDLLTDLGYFSNVANATVTNHERVRDVAGIVTSYVESIIDIDDDVTPLNPALVTAPGPTSASTAASVRTLIQQVPTSMPTNWI